MAQNHKLSGVLQILIIAITKSQFPVVTELHHSTARRDVSAECSKVPLQRFHTLLTTTVAKACIKLTHKTPCMLKKVSIWQLSASLWTKGEEAGLAILETMSHHILLLTIVLL